MGNPKQKWTEEEEEALLAGVAKHGPGKWTIIIKDPDFAHFLTHRTNVDLKDKWRNLGPSISSRGSKEKTRDPKIVNIRSSSIRENASPHAAMDDPSNSTLDGKSASRYNAMIFEALSTMKDVNGSDFVGILNFIKQRHDMALPPNFRRLMSTRLRRLVLQGKVEKVKNGYKLKKEALLGSKTPTPKQEDIRPQQLQNFVLTTSVKKLKEISDTAAYKVADAENKSFLAAEAMKEAERILKMAEETESILHLVHGEKPSF
ncbi:Histone H1 [Morus notabilis]|uniref:MYB transcription factor n=1 Tax=Morus notabilis TaxID=981085 RepID=W9QDW0_9ROSA|nr:Histone H1 [Morus notabilis]